MIVEGIERLSRSKQLKEVEKLIDHVKVNVIEAVYGTEIANIFFKPFKERVIGKPLLRKKCTFEVYISCLDKELTSNSIVTLDVTLTFEVVIALIIVLSKVYRHI